MLARSGTMIRKKGRGGSMRGRGRGTAHGSTTPRRGSDLSREPSTKSAKSDSALFQQHAGIHGPRHSSDSAATSTSRGSHDSGVFLLPPDAEGGKQPVGKTLSSPLPSQMALLTIRAREQEQKLLASGWGRDISLDQPNYGSVTLQITEANKESESSYEFVRKAAEILHGTTVVTVLLVSFIGVPLAMISLGIKYLNECPIEPKIPIYLLVGGCVGLLKLLSLLWGQVRSRKYEKLDEGFGTGDDNFLDADSSRFMDAILSLFLTGWFAAGNYWVLSIYKPNFTQQLRDPNNWCEKTVYMFAFCQICGCYGLMALIILLIFILFLAHRCCSGGTDNS